MLSYGEELRSVLLFEKKLSASCLSHAPRPVCVCSDAKMSASPSPFQEDCVCVLFEPCSSSRLFGCKNVCNYYSRKDVCYVDECVSWRARVYRVDFTIPTCARLM